MKEKFETLLQDEEFARKLFSLEADTEIQSFLAENGVEFSLEEIAALKAGVKALVENEDEELSDDMLENVAGGSYLSEAWEGFSEGFTGTMKAAWGMAKDLLSRW